MEITFARRQLQKDCTDEACLADVPTVPPYRRHQLKGDRHEQFAVNLGGQMRLVFDVANDPIPRRADGGLDLLRVSAIRILDVVDYHE